MKSSMQAAGDYARRIWGHRDLAFYLALGKIKATNAATTLGMLWWVLNPLLLAGIYFLVFGVMFGAVDEDRSGAEYLGYLLSGIFPFHFTNRCVLGGSSAVTANARLITNLRFPRIILPASVLIEALIGFLASLFAFFLIVVPLSGSLPGSELVWLVPALLIHLTMNLGLAAMVGRLAVTFRDIGNFLPYLLRLWLYLSPIIWTVDLVEGLSPTLLTLAELNPMFSLLSVYRTALTDAPFDPTMLWLATGWAVLLAGVGCFYFIKGESRLTRYL